MPKGTDVSACRALLAPGLFVLAASMLPLPDAAAQTQKAAPDARHVSVEVFIRGSDPNCQAASQTAQSVLGARAGVVLQVHDLDGEDSETNTARLKQIAEHFSADPEKLPVVYACNAIVQGYSGEEDFASRLRGLLRIDVYARDGCPHCQKAKGYLAVLGPRYPGFEIRIHEITRDADARNEMNRLARHYKQAAVSVPVFHFCNQLIVGFDNASTTGRRIESVLQYWTFPAPKQVGFWKEWNLPALTMPAALWQVNFVQADETVPNATGPPESAPPPPLPPPPLPLPGGGPVSSDEASLPPASESLPPIESDAIDLPWLGHLRLGDVGLPLFTILVGLVDGFNPCAMWVLLFLLSILVNLRSRARILLVAGTFVIVSGAAYFAFMAAWLNVFMLIGYLRPVQIFLGVLAIAVGSVHVKDFFAFKKGISLSIPDSAKPGIYVRVERIVRAENVIGALIGAIVLAVLVNIIELLCTAGLPAMYTQILSLQKLPAWKNYAYLLLYNLAYMFDDSVMVLLVTVTMGKRKMQERQGRYLKLISGLAIIVLGVIMIVRPGWLV
jgi:glutaredoxin